MPTITITISESAYREARTWAAKHDTSVSALVRYCIEGLSTFRIAKTAAAATARKPKVSADKPASASEISHEIKNTAVKL